jgi:hypothetical protein
MVFHGFVSFSPIGICFASQKSRLATRGTMISTVKRATPSARVVAGVPVKVVLKNKSSPV